MPTRKLRVNSKTQKAELLEDDKVLKTYRISTAAKGLSNESGSLGTPTGKHKVGEKYGDGAPIGMIFKARLSTGNVWTPQMKTDEDLVLTRILWLEGLEAHNQNSQERFIYLHGTNQEEQLGTPASHGCVRFSNSDIIEVFDLLESGDEVEIF